MSMRLEIRRYSGGDRHFHDYNQILFPLQGSMRIDIEGRSGVVASHSLAIIPEHCIHDFEPSPDCRMLILDVETSVLADGMRPDILRNAAPIVTHVDPWLWRLFCLLGAEVEADAGRAGGAARLALTGLELVRPGHASHRHRSSSRGKCSRLRGSMVSCC